MEIIHKIGRRKTAVARIYMSEGTGKVTVNGKEMDISRALVELDAENRAALKPEGLMTRDPRMVERKKFGQKKARKKFQFSKR